MTKRKSRTLILAITVVLVLSMSVIPAMARAGDGGTFQGYRWTGSCNSTGARSASASLSYSATADRISVTCIVGYQTGLGAAAPYNETSGNDYRYDSSYASASASAPSSAYARLYYADYMIAYNGNTTSISGTRGMF